MARMTNTQKLEASREARLWIGQVLVPIGGVLLLVPEAREWAKDKAMWMADKAKAIFRKK